MPDDLSPDAAALPAGMLPDAELVVVLRAAARSKNELFNETWFGGRAHLLESQ